MGSLAISKLRRFGLDSNMNLFIGIGIRIKIWVLFVFLVNIACAQEASKLFFLRIPKTGSGTAFELCSQHYAFEDVGLIGWKKVSEEKMLQLVDEKKMIHGHLLYSQVRPYLQDFIKMTFLRDPLERVLSEHRHLLDATKKSKENHFLPGEGDPIDTAENNMCLMLSSLDPLNPLIPIEMHLESAKESLLEFDFIGLTEEIEASLQLIYSKFGWGAPEIIPRYNQTTPEERPSGEVLDAIKKRNWADIELYAFAKELFKKQQIQEPFSTPPIHWVSQIDYDFSCPLDGWGWYPIRHCELGVFRWTDLAEEAYLYFPLIQKPYSIAIEVCVSDKVESDMHFYINGHSLSFKKIPIHYEIPRSTADRENRTPRRYFWYRCEGTIPSQWISPGEKTEVKCIIDGAKKRERDTNQRGRLGIVTISFH